MLNVKGRWALVTGAARGIGYGAALFMAKQGCNLVLQARKAEHLKNIVFIFLALVVLNEDKSIDFKEVHP